jgi:hypothetical protein
MSDVPPIGTPGQQPGSGHGGERGRMATWLRQPKNVLGLVVTALTVWFILANDSETRIRFWVVWVTTKLWVALVITFVAGLIVGYLLKRRSVGKRAAGRQ